MRMSVSEWSLSCEWSGVWWCEWCVCVALPADCYVVVRFIASAAVSAAVSQCLCVCVCVVASLVSACVCEWLVYVV